MKNSLRIFVLFCFALSTFTARADDETPAAKEPAAKVPSKIRRQKK